MASRVNVIVLHAARFFETYRKGWIKREGKRMKRKNVLITVKDMERSIAFYKELFGLDVVLNQDGNVILTEGLVLQDVGIWKEFLKKEVIFRNHAAELYFEEADLDRFVKKLENYKEPVEYVNHLTEHSWGQKVIRFYDPDGNLIEVGTPMRTTDD